MVDVCLRSLNRKVKGSVGISLRFVNFCMRRVVFVVSCLFKPLGIDLRGVTYA